MRSGSTVDQNTLSVRSGYRLSIRIHHEVINSTKRRTHLEALGAAGLGGEDVERVHGADDEVGAVPGLAAAAAAQTHRPPLQTAHAHRR